MSDIFKLFGFALLLLAALLIGRSYAAYCKKRTLEVESFYEFVGHISKEITLFLSVPKRFTEGYSDERLEAAGFLPSLREGESLRRAFEKARSNLSLGEPTKEKLSRFFSDFGKNYKEGEIKRCELFREELERLLSYEREEEEKRIKLGYTLLFASALAVIILLI